MNVSTLHRKLFKKGQEVRSSSWRGRVRAGFKDDFEILEIVFEPQVDEPNPAEEQDEFLGWEGEDRDEQEKPVRFVYRISTGFLLGIIGVSLGLIAFVV
jgi:hypothetical protein